MLPTGVDCVKEAGRLALGRGRKGDYAKATVTAQRTEGREEGKVPEQAQSGHRNIKDQEKRLCPRVLRTSINAGSSQALCHLELRGMADVPSRKAGRDESRSRPATPCCTPPCVWLESPSAQSFEHAHSACVVHLGTKALAGAAPPGPYQSPLNGELDLS